MTASDLRDNFNSISQPAYSCTSAFLGYSREHDQEWQNLTFHVTAADGTELVITSDPIPPHGDVDQAARDTAQKLLTDGVPAP